MIDDPDSLEISDLESFYIEAKARFDADDDFKTESRETVVKLQGGDPVTRTIWKAFCDESLRHCHAILRSNGRAPRRSRRERLHRAHERW